MQQTKMERFDNYVRSRYNVYNSIFTTLPFDLITNTGVLLPLFTKICEQGYNKKENPTQIVNAFFEKYAEDLNDKQRLDLLFRFIQYIERQVVLFDAIEDAAFPIIYNLEGRGTLRGVKEEAQETYATEALREYMKGFQVRTVLTAHPTQFSPGQVLGIITDLAKAIENNALTDIQKLLGQLGKTPFFKKEKPTPYEEAVRLIWYLENVFYTSVSNIYKYINTHIFEGETLDNPIVSIGFWPGGDRDGNPFVTTQTTLDVAQRLRTTLFRNYYRDMRALRRRLTFKGIDERTAVLQQELYDHIFLNHDEVRLTPAYLLKELGEIRQTLIEQHQSLFLDQLDSFIGKVKLFGCHFASLDIRQDSRVHSRVVEAIASETKGVLPENYASLNDEEKISALVQIQASIDPQQLQDEMAQKTLGAIYAMKTIQKANGEVGCSRYIISNNGSVLNVMEAFAMLFMCDWPTPTVDVVPLFETIDDLAMADEVMATLYQHPDYLAHLKRRGMKQTVMLGFSDGTKDGGYLMANWSIYRAKENITRVSRQHGISVSFFDGRGGPPARGGGKTHQFYASLGPNIEHNVVELTIQGQTISSNFGTPESCQYNLEQLLSSGISGEVFAADKNLFSEADRATMEQLGQRSYAAYQEFKNHDCFLPYLERMSTLKYYAKTNIGSRPSKRGGKSELVFSDLRAIPFVGSWSQLKQNVPGFYGLGTALQAMKAAGQWEDAVALYKNSVFFKTLVENAMMSMSKSFFPLTAYMQDDPEFGAFWNMIFEEFERTRDLLLELTGSKQLMEDAPVMRASIQMREQIVLPLLTIQQFALREIQKLRAAGAKEADLAVFEKMVTRSLFGNINAARNSA